MSDKDPRLEVGSEEDYEPTYGSPKVSTSNDVSFQKDERFGAKQGILSTQPVGPQGSQGRRPPVQQVVNAQEDKGATRRAVKKQVGENLYPINKKAAENKNHGPNN